MLVIDQGKHVPLSVVLIMPDNWIARVSHWLSRILYNRGLNWNHYSGRWCLRRWDMHAIIEDVDDGSPSEIVSLVGDGAIVPRPPVKGRYAILKKLSQEK